MLLKQKKNSFARQLQNIIAIGNNTKYYKEKISNIHILFSLQEQTQLFPGSNDILFDENHQYRAVIFDTHTIQHIFYIPPS